MATRPERRITYQDYVTFPDGERYEVIDGEAFVIPSPSLRHQLIVGELYRQVSNFVHERGGGVVCVAPFDVVLDEQGDILQPDIVFIADDDRDVLTDANVWGTPSWVVEVLSSDRARDRKLKLARYERFGVPEYWIVDPFEDQVEVYRLEGDRYPAPTLTRPPGTLSPLRPAGLRIDLDMLLTSSR